MNQTYKIAVFTSGHSRGSNYKAICEYIRKNELPVKVDFVLVTDPDAPITETCKNQGIDTVLYNKNLKSLIEGKTL